MVKLLVRYKTHSNEGGWKVVASIIPEYKGNSNIEFQEFPDDKDPVKVILISKRKHRGKPMSFDSRMNVYHMAVYAHTETREKLNVEAKDQGFLILDVRTNTFSEFAIDYSKKHEQITRFLKQYLRSKRFPIVDVTRSDRFGDEIAIHLPGKRRLRKGYTLIGKFLEPFNTDLIYEYIQSPSQVADSKNFLREAIGYLLSQKTF